MAQEPFRVYAALVPQLTLPFHQKPEAPKLPPVPEGFEGFTTARLKELLDRTQWEVSRFQDEDAIRDMILIEAELRRRAEERTRKG